jgi:hypothetical protein
MRDDVSEVDADEDNEQELREATDGILEVRAHSANPQADDSPAGLPASAERPVSGFSW